MRVTCPNHTLGMQKFIFSAFFCFCTFSPKLFAQNISKADALEDLRFFNQAIKAGHPTNYNPKLPKTNLNDLIKRVEALEQDTLKTYEYRLLLGEAISQTKCVHTYLLDFPLKQSPKQISYIPLKFHLLGADLWVKKDTTNLILGQRVLSINGMKSEILHQVFSKLYGSDGGTSALSLEVFNQHASTSISQFFAFPSEYRVETENGVYTFQGMKKPFTPEKETEPAAILKNNKNHYSISGQVSILKIVSFDRSDKAFFKDAISQVKKRAHQNLVIDLRGNTGGNRKAAVVLAKQLVTEPFSYSILQPKLKPGRFLSGQGRFFLFLARVKYNLGNFYRGKGTELGYSFNYRYRPQKEPFKGEIFVLTDGWTASSATMLSSWLKQFANTKIAGAQAAGGYNGNNGGGFPRIVLPKSKAKIQFPAYRLVFDAKSTQDAGWIPDLELKPSAADLLKKEDVFLNALWGIMK
jgi:Peptidase family S41